MFNPCSTVHVKILRIIEVPLALGRTFRTVNSVSAGDHRCGSGPQEVTNGIFFEFLQK